MRSHESIHAVVRPKSHTLRQGCSPGQARTEPWLWRSPLAALLMRRQAEHKCLLRVGAQSSPLRVVRTRGPGMQTPRAPVFDCAPLAWRGPWDRPSPSASGHEPSWHSAVDGCRRRQQPRHSDHLPPRHRLGHSPRCQPCYGRLAAKQEWKPWWRHRPRSCHQGLPRFPCWPHRYPLRHRAAKGFRPGPRARNRQWRAPSRWWRCLPEHQEG
mmetsp:Transcript_76291/g.236837  ORF Transcript_76291/g.236837 Transcript_76291/m.236837 type:complete len:212 (+) Transcript_76291:32-667(+)